MQCINMNRNYTTLSYRQIDKWIHAYRHDYVHACCNNEGRHKMNARASANKDRSHALHCNNDYCEPQVKRRCVYVAINHK